MILVILGTQKFQCNRLLKLIDNLVLNGKLKESIFAQIGNSTYIPQNYSYERFLDKDEFEKKILESSLVITHSGVGSIISAVNKKKPIIVFPRLKKYGEHVDDHQIEIAEAFEKKNYVKIYRENDNLERLIEKVKTHEFSVYNSQRKKIIDEIYNFLEL